MFFEETQHLNFFFRRSDYRLVGMCGDVGHVAQVSNVLYLSSSKKQPFINISGLGFSSRKFTTGGRLLVALKLQKKSLKTSMRVYDLVKNYIDSTVATYTGLTSYVYLRPLNKKTLKLYRNLPERLFSTILFVGLTHYFKTVLYKTARIKKRIKKKLLQMV